MYVCRRHATRWPGKVYYWQYKGRYIFQDSNNYNPWKLQKTRTSPHSPTVLSFYKHPRNTQICHKHELQMPTNVDTVNAIINKTYDVEGPGVYVYEIKGIVAKDCETDKLGKIYKIGRSERNVLSRLKEEAAEMKRWQTPCEMKLVDLKLGKENVGYEKDIREQYGQRLTYIDRKESEEALKKMSGDATTTKNKLKVRKGWAEWLGVNTKLGPSEFVFVSETKANRVEIDFNGKSIGKLVFNLHNSC